MELLHTLNPVTALSFVDTESSLLLLAGEGPFLKVFDIDRGHLVAQQRVFKSQSVRGIAVGGEFTSRSKRVLVWGGQYIGVVLLSPLMEGIPCNHGDFILTIHRILTAPDWLLDGCWGPTCFTKECHAVGKSRAVLVTAHNALLVLQPSEEEDDVRLEALSASSRSIIYSAHLAWLSPSRILIAAGTVFGDILVWSCAVDEPSASRSTVHHLYKGHEGSVFGVQISEEIPSTWLLPRRRLLASCSDDRTIQIWPIIIDESGKSEDLGQIDEKSIASHETGFSTLPEAPSPKGRDGHLAKAWGHASRIWRVVWAPMQTGTAVLSLHSFGEDATSQEWALKPETGPRASPPEARGIGLVLSHLQTSSTHTGKNIWSAAVTVTANGQAMVVTGGADGRINLRIVSQDPHSLVYPSWSITDIGAKASKRLSLSRPLQISHIMANDIGVLSAKNDPSQRADNFRGFSYVTGQNFLLTTNLGFVYLSSFGESGMNGEVTSPTEELQWIRIAQLEGATPFTHISCSPCEGVAFFAATNGRVYYYSVNAFGPLTSGHGRIASMFSQFSTLDQIHLLITPLDGRVAQYCDFSLSSLQGPSPPESPELRQLCLPSTFAVTSMLVLETEDLLLVGSRYGAIAVYDLRVVRQASEQHSSEATISFRRVHGEDAITSMLQLPSVAESRGPFAYILSTARNGTYAVHAVSHSGELQVTISLETIHLSYPPVGPLIEGAYVDKFDVVLYGFRSKRFVVWNETRQREVINVDCGGAHRTWDFRPAVDRRGGFFAWTQASRIYLHSHREAPCQVLQDGGQGREIKAVAIGNVRPERGQRPWRLIATGAEDTAIRLMAYEEDGKMRVLKTKGIFKKHTTGIQHLQWSECGRCLFSSGGVGEFFCWRVGQIPCLGVGMVREAVCPVEVDNPDLRIMSFDATTLEGHGQTGTEISFLISMAYSDSTIQTYQYIPVRKSFELLLVGRYKSCCLMQASHHMIADELYLCTAGTDGYLAFFNLTHPLRSKGITVHDGRLLRRTSVPSPTATAKWQYRTAIHQSSIKSMTTVRIDAHTLLLASGGDDNALAFTLARFSSSSAPSFSTLLLPTAHASAITASLTCPSSPSDESTETMRFATTSNDQRLKLWGVTLDTALPGVQGLQVQRIGNEASPVADAGGMAVLNDGMSAAGEEESGRAKIVLVGVGVDVWAV